MFYSQSFLSRKGALGSIWVAAYCFKKLKKSQVKQTDISSSVDKILQDEFDVVTYRVLAYLLLGVVRIFSKKVEYLYDDCNKVLLKIKEFVANNKDRALVKTLSAPYFSITLPQRFELDAFDLEILEDTSGGHVMPHEDITLKDHMWKTGAIVPYTLDKYRSEEFASCRDTCAPGYAVNEDVFTSHLSNFDMEVGTSHDLINLEASVENLKGSRYSLCEFMDLEMFSVVEEEPIASVKPFCEDLQNKGENMTLRAPEVVNTNEIHAESSMPQFWESSISREACLNLQVFGELEEGPVNPVKQISEHHQTEGQQIKFPPSENENHQVSKEDCYPSNIEASREQLRDNIVSQEECRDMEIFCVVEEPPEHGIPFYEEHQSDKEPSKLFEEPLENARLFDEEHQSTAEHKTILEYTSPGNSTPWVLKEDHPLSVTLDTTPRSNFPAASGVTTPEFLTIPTPAAKEGARVARKRKCLLDDVIVFPNKVIKQCIEDSSDLVCKRRKAPHTALAAWRRSCQVSCLPQCFLKPLIPCTSLELRSLFFLNQKKLLEKFMSEHPTVHSSVETVEPLEKLDNSNACSSHKQVENMMTLEKVNVSAFPTVGRLIETVEPTEKLDLPESPTAGGSLEKAPIAPETPVLHTKSLRSFESPERPEISNLDGGRTESDKVEKELPPCKEQVLGLNLINNEIILCEEDNQDHYGWSDRTRVVMRCLDRSFLNEKKQRKEEEVNLLQLLEGRTRRESARLFYELLVLKSKGYVHVKQESAYADILVWKTSQWSQACAADCAGSAQ